MSHVIAELQRKNEEYQRLISYMHAKYVPTGQSGPVKVERFTVSEDQARMFNIRAAIGNEAGTIEPGEYTRLMRGGSIWMSDTPSEVRDHYPVVRHLAYNYVERVLINGLGLGVVLNAVLHDRNVRHVDVVEMDPDVIKLVGSHYENLASLNGVDLRIHEGDATAVTWPKGTRWGMVWHDIWEHITGDNWEEMKWLHRRYQRKTTWQDSWRRDEVKYLATGRD